MCRRIGHTAELTVVQSITITDSPEYIDYHVICLASISKYQFIPCPYHCHAIHANHAIHQSVPRTSDISMYINGK